MSEVRSLTAPEKATNTFAVPVLDGIRAVAFMLVFLAHAGLSHLVPGGLGVTIFFFLSGYLITTLLWIESRRSGTISLRDFYVKRAFRILPPMYVTLLLGAIATSVGVLKGEVHVPALLAAFGYVSNYYRLIMHRSPGPVGGMGIVWSLAVEEHFYLIFPLLVLVSLKRKMSGASRSCALLGACLAALLWRTFLVFVIQVHIPHGQGQSLDEGWTYLATDCRFDSIAWGCLLATYTNPWNGSSPWLARYKGWMASLGIAVILGTLGYRNSYFRETLRYTLQGAALYPVFYYLVATPYSKVARLLSSQPLRWVGWVSYSLYLVHLLLLEEFARYMRPMLAGICALSVALLYGWLIRSTIDLPMRALRSHLTHRQSERDTVLPVPEYGRLSA